MTDFEPINNHEYKITDGIDEKELIEFFHKLEICKNTVTRLKGLPPSPYYESMDPDDHTEDDLPGYFHAGCNMLCVPREIEITKFSMLSALEQSLKSVKETTKLLNLLDSCFHIRNLLEIFSYYMILVDDAIEQTKSLKKKNIHNFSGQEITEIGDIQGLWDAYKKIRGNRMNVSFDLEEASLARENKDASAEINTNSKNASILSYLKKVNRKLPEIHPLYVVCSEIIHPNFMLNFGNIDLSKLIETNQSC